MISELDKIKSTITISLGTKNRLRDLKGSESYEDFINHLIRLRNDLAHGKEISLSKNRIELSKTKRKKAIYSFNTFKVVFTYNTYNNSSNFIFDPAIEKISYKGKEISKDYVLDGLSAELTNKTRSENECMIYFKLLEKAIQEEIDPMFKHKGRIEDYYLWKKEINNLNLPKSVYEEDIIEKLNELE
jgi:hypothetical protein